MSAIILLEGNDKRKAIRQVVTRSENLAKGVRDTARLLRAVSRRERIETTGIGHGVAIAHGKILGLDTVHVGLGVSWRGAEGCAHPCGGVGCGGHAPYPALAPSTARDRGLFALLMAFCS